MSNEQNLEKIRALLNKTIENGATEQEAMQAIALAKRMMEKHQVTLDDLKTSGIPKEDLIWGYSSTPFSVFESFVSKAISIYTGTKTVKVYGSAPRRGHRRTAVISFFGHRVDVELAIFMLNACKVALNTEWDKYASENHIHKGRIADFASGMAMSIMRKISELVAEEKKNATQDGTALVVLKDQIVVAALEKSAPNITYSNVKTVVEYKDDNAFRKGVEAGDRVELHRKFSDKKVLKLK